MKRNRKRYRASVIAISISIIVFISIYSLVSQLEKSVRLEHAYKNYNLVSYINRSTNETDNGSIDEYRKNLDKLVKSVIEDEEYSIVKRFYAYMETKYLSEDLLKFFQEKQGYSKDDKSIGITINVLDDKSFEKTLKENGLKGNGLYLACNEYFIKTDDGKKYSFKSFKDKSISYSYDQNNYRNEEIENPISFKEDVNLEFIKKVPIGFDERDGNRGINLIVKESDFKENPIFSDEVLYINSINPHSTLDKIADYERISETEKMYFDNLDEARKMRNNILTILKILSYGFIIVISLIGITNIFNAVSASIILKKESLHLFYLMV